MADISKPLFPGACDAHVHIVGSADRFPQLAHAPYIARTATVQSLRAIAEPVGLSRFVVVQPSFYGTDHSCLLNALDQLGDSGRGVVVVEAASTRSRTLDSYAKRGICGLRLNFYSSPVTDAHRKLERSLLEIRDIVPAVGWHVEVIARAQTLAAAAAAIGQSEVPIVIDHYGLPENEAPSDPTGRALLALAAAPHVWIKLSAPYRVGSDQLATLPPAEWLEAFVQTAPDRCIWGSDWPHTPPRNDPPDKNKMLPYRNIAYHRLIDDFVDAVGSAELAHRILIENPIRLYGFPRPPAERSE
jgi:predicted TIM-barrel fold metal-dependent hydrolase